MDILGHSQIAVTMNIYAHVLPVMQHEAASQINAALSPYEDTESTARTQQDPETL
jgi:hypothetical protein